MKRIFAAAVVGFAFASTAQAGTTPNNFNVSTTLTSQCSATNSGTTTVDFGTYVAFQPGAQASTSVNLQFQCTRGVGAHARLWRAEVGASRRCRETRSS